MAGILGRRQPCAAPENASPAIGGSRNTARQGIASGPPTAFFSLDNADLQVVRRTVASFPRASASIAPVGRQAEARRLACDRRSG